MWSEAPPLRAGKGWGEMKDLIEALTIFAKYKDERWPTICVHDELIIVGIGRAEISTDDQKRLVELGFDWDDHDDHWRSFRFGSA
jgi:hypothetical protein